MSQPVGSAANATATPAADPRPAYAAATAWVIKLCEAIQADQWDNPTPCTAFDVRTLAAHLVGTGRRAVALGAGTDIFAVSPIAEVSDAASYAAAVQEARRLWSDDASLTTPKTVPWGTVPGAQALWGYVNETLVHGWDLAVATDHDHDPEHLAEHAIAALERAHDFLPSHIRSDSEVPFGPVVDPRRAAGPTERLANWSGRISAGWV